jgi:putative endonuclease
LGTDGELLAASWLQGKGFAILHRNWRYSRYEVDIVAVKDGVLHFVEIKTRSNNSFGQPEESVNKKKIRNLLIAGAEYQRQYPTFKRVQYDILSITVLPGNIDYFFIEDIYL